MSVNKDKVLIEVQGLQKAFGSNQVLDGITTDICQGEVVVVVGPSGSGKSTFLRSLNLLEVPTGGKILFEGTDITDPKVDINRHRQKIGMVFQRFNLFPHKTVKENIMLAPVTLKLMTKEEASAKADELLERVGLPDKADTYPEMLSGGQMQRLMIARIFLLKPKILIADEPTSMVDACSRATILDMLLKLRDEINMTIIFITHDIGLAYYVSDTVYIMEHGKFVEAGSAEDVIIHPQAAYTRRLISDVPKIYGEWDLSTVSD